MRTTTAFGSTPHDVMILDFDLGPVLELSFFSNLFPFSFLEKICSGFFGHLLLGYLPTIMTAFCNDLPRLHILYRLGNRACLDRDSDQ